MDKDLRKSLEEKFRAVEEDMKSSAIREAKAKKIVPIFKNLFKIYLDCKQIDGRHWMNSHPVYPMAWVHYVDAYTLAKLYITRDDSEFKFYITNYLDEAELARLKLFPLFKIRRVDKDDYSIRIFYVRLNLDELDKRICKEDIELTKEEIQVTLKEWEERIKKANGDLSLNKDL